MLTLWLPVLVSTIALFVASFLSWMVLKLHEKDWGKLPDEDKLMEAVRQSEVPEGNYMFPACGAKGMGDPEFAAKYKAGPRGVITVFPAVNMGVNLGLTLLFFLACNLTFAYLASFALAGRPETDFVTIFRFVGTVALLTFLASIVQHAVWFRIRIVGHVVESIAYALIAGAIFAALWPT